MADHDDAMDVYKDCTCLHFHWTLPTLGHKLHCIARFYQLSVHSVLLEWRYIHDFIQLALDPWKTSHKFVASDVHVNFLRSISIPALEPLTKSIEIPERSVPVLPLCGMLFWNGVTKSVSSITKTSNPLVVSHDSACSASVISTGCIQASCDPCHAAVEEYHALHHLTG